MADFLEFTLNGRLVRAENISPNTTLLEFLRASGQTGSKEGCAEGDCGACSVAIIDRDSAGKPTYRAINSCLIPICLLAGREIISIEGIAQGKNLHPVQQKMVECHGSQCGYCTPGFVMSLFEGFYRNDFENAQEIDDQLCGNLCRCTGYRSIAEAANAAFAPENSREDFFATRLKNSAPHLDPIQYASENEKFFRPTSLDELLGLIKKFPDARLIAGATELGLDITKKYKKFPTLISVEAILELKTIHCDNSKWTIGAAATLTEIDDVVGEEIPALRKMLRVFGSRQIRNRATMGGNIVTASPIGDSAPVLLALDAKIVLVSRDGERIIPIEQFFISYRKTALRDGEILKAILIPHTNFPDGITQKSEWFKVSKRREMDISTVAACFNIELDSQNSVRRARLAFGGVAAMPSRAVKTEQALLGKFWNAETISAALPILEKEFSPISDVRGDAQYRKNLVTSLLEKFFHGETQEVFAQKIIPENKSSTRPLPHESAHKHVTGEAIYTDDQTAGKNILEVWPICSPHAHAKILKRDATLARQMPGIKAVLLAEDIPGANDVGAIRHDEILLADKEVLFHGHLVALVVGETQAACRAAAEKFVVEYEPLLPILKIEDALAQKSFHTEPNFIRRGEIKFALQNSPLTLEGEFSFGGQEHFYLESQAAWAERGEDGSMLVVSSTQHPSEVQHIIAHLLH
ncbi:MAG: xanthine dehydrogenase small subunit, partial [Verrucomicrobiota bacterium]|nr:xanthine dehydrogenase small subunit [Verrucomicrobiota bacterium]